MATLLPRLARGGTISARPRDSADYARRGAGAAPSVARRLDPVHGLVEAPRIESGAHFFENDLFDAGSAVVDG